jgi:hypothetical protein
LICLTLGIAPGCGKDVGDPNSGGSGNSNPPGLNNTVEGPCTVIGNVRSFEINCTKTIQTFTVGIFTIGSRLENTSTINGQQYNSTIQNNGTSLVGTETIAPTLEIKINFTDSSTCSVTLRH